MARNEKILTGLAERRRLVMAPFPSDVIEPANWVDSCHLNAAGAKQKAAHVLPYILQALGRDADEKAE